MSYRLGHLVFISKKKIFLLGVFCVVSFNAFSQESKFVIGANAMYRFIEPGYSYFYPRLSFEYHLTRVSSFDFLAEYVNHQSAWRRYISFPLSAGIKLNVIPWFTKNEKITERLRVYGAFRYTFLPSAANPDKPFQKFYVFHKIRFAPGAEYWFHRHWGANIEMVFGDNLKTTMGLGIKYRF